MLKVLREGETVAEPCALLLGGFDGFHAGHMTLLTEARKTGLPVGLTSISGDKGGDVFTFSERERIFDRLGLDFVLEIRFTEQFKNTPADVFLQELFGWIAVGSVFCGEDFRFGKGALGTSELLKELAPCPVAVLPLKTADGTKIAVSQIKRWLSQGRTDAVNRWFCCDYFLSGTVERGRGVGHTLGFPTANVSFPAEKFPIRDGVYGGYAVTEYGRFPAVMNFGARPTFSVGERKAEAYLKGFDGDLYGRLIELYPTRYLRPIVKFSSEEELKAQLKKDAENCGENPTEEKND